MMSSLKKKRDTNYMITAVLDDIDVQQNNQLFLNIDIQPIIMCITSFSF